jgi:hypothetical protein
MDVDVDLPAPSRPLANARLYCNARERDDGFRKKLATGVGTYTAATRCPNGAPLFRSLPPVTAYRSSRSLALAHRAGFSLRAEL